jgi:hypothetical protein
MKALILLLLPITLISQDCDKYFHRKRDIGDIFEESILIRTKQKSIVNDGARVIKYNLYKDNDSVYMNLVSMIGGSLFKKPIVFSENCRIAFVFESGDNYIIKFKQPENRVYVHANILANGNYFLVDYRLISLLNQSYIKSIQIKEPFNDGSGKIKEFYLFEQTSHRLRDMVNCIMVK